MPKKTSSSFLVNAFKTSAMALSIGFSANAVAQESVHIYNWSDYITDEAIADFEKQSGIKVVYDVYDSNEVLEAKLLAGKSGYDLVFPTARPFVDRHIQAGIYQKLDKTQLPNYQHLDADIMKSLADIDSGNAYAVPYMWGTSGIGINIKKVKEILGDEMPLDTWALLFDPKITAKLKQCGISLMDDVTEVFAAAHAYKGQDSNDYSKNAINDASETVRAVRDNIRYFHSSQYINDLANGDLCVAHGYSGDILQARDRADEAKNGVEIAYLAPKEGAVVWTDVMVIPADAPNAKAAHTFINYILEPKVIAPITNYVAYANANKDATDLVDEEVRNDQGIYPPAETRANFLVIKTPTDKQARNMNRAWTRVKTGQ
ncbi:polyamine ABC transporter substrate-binding protein [Thiomicrorhabdus sp. 6S2-11]|uniref:Putrescine-binding periplasmic protein n=1 Tax=Thiomicrorhabdus marina TaxID=2818442 RepID=A0ABS3Q170_9GAMM|nr:polyamine ABC transporter substrate-binding protein [Thiomicrorhabdus marina]MBO1926059.1 polyamine ABC transporter substrate-binding protein [Thiomicrorhabdus marina]